MPVGTVTFLLTDIEGSTSWWETRPDDMAEAVPAHYRILDEHIGACGGRRPEEQGEGDSVVGVFVHVRDALDAATAAQLALHRELPWLRVRMAVHTGDAQLRDESNYVGPTIIRAARLRACAHGGQIIVSDASAALASDALPPGCRIDALGTVRLNGTTRPERVWQLTHPDLPDGFPPLPALEATPTNVPAATTSLIGRSEHAATVIDLLRANRLVTLTGSGGCGKTRLAQHVASAMLNDRPGGVWWADLAPLTDPAGVGERVGSAVCLAQSIDHDVTDAVVQHLARQGAVLVVIDNAEHVLATVAHLVDAIVGGCPDTTVLVTSREPLGVLGETVYRVLSLELPPEHDDLRADDLQRSGAARLFIERARQARADLVVDDRNARHVAAICVRLDGIPLALELAAARARAIPLDRLAGGLDDAFRLLTGGSRTSLPRQQTLLASIAWSVDHLDDIERSVLHRLAVFRSTLSLDAAEAVGCDDTTDPFDVLDAIERLVDKSLLQFDSNTGRYRMLETIRQYCLDQWRGNDELRAARDRHARWCADWAEAAGDGRRGMTFNRSHPVRADLMAALDWAMLQAPVEAYRILWGLRGPIRHRMGHYQHLHLEYEWVRDREAALADAHESVLWARAVAGLSGSSPLMLWSDFGDIVARATALIPNDDRAARRHLEYSESVMNAVLTLETTALDRNFAEAEICDDDIAYIAYSDTVMFVSYALGDFDRCDTISRRVSTLIRQRGESFDLAAAHGTYAFAIGAFAERGRIAEAIEVARRCAIGRGELDSVAIACAVGQIALMVEVSGATELLAIVEDMSTTEQPAVTAGVLPGARGFLADSGGDPTTALAYFREFVRSWSLNWALASSLPSWCVMALLRGGESDEAEQVLRRLEAACATASLPPNSMPLVQCDQLRAAKALNEQRFDEARTRSHRALTAAHTAGFALRVVDCLEVIAVTASHRGATVDAARLLAATDCERRRIGYVHHRVVDRTMITGLAERLQVDEPADWYEGERLTIDDAVELAQRSRGDRGRPTHGWDSLTPTELKVVELVAEGLTNDAVARGLIMSPATVKTHLTHVYAKTAAANRTELAAQWRSRP